MPVSMLVRDSELKPLINDAPVFDVCVIGLGYVGLPLAASLAKTGARVLGVDIDLDRLARLEDGQHQHDEQGLGELVEAVLRAGQLKLTDAPAPSKVYLIATPTQAPTSSLTADDGQSALRAAIEALLPTLLPHALIIVEATCAPGTVREQVVHRLSAHGLIIGQDVFVAHCPERILPGHALRELIEDPRVLAGATEACAERARAFYASFVRAPITTLSSLEAAEATKLIENAAREVSVAFVNELADWSRHQGLDVMELIGAANTHPRVDLLRPGVGVGGRCLPLSSTLLLLKDPHGELGLIHRARQLHEALPEQLARQIIAAIAPQPLADDSTAPAATKKVALLGVAYKPDVADWRGSAALKLYEALAGCAALTLSVHDPWLSQWPHSKLCTLDEAITDADVIVIATAHTSFSTLNPTELDAQTRGKLIFDLCRALPGPRWLRAGWDYRAR